MTSWTKWRVQSQRTHKVTSTRSLWSLPAPFSPSFCTVLRSKGLGGPLTQVPSSQFQPQARLPSWTSAHNTASVLQMVRTARVALSSQWPPAWSS
jgi:hypothetical protein